MAPSSLTSLARVFGTTSPASQWRTYAGTIPTPWLSWPARFAWTRWSATRSASRVSLPPDCKIALVIRRKPSDVTRIASLRSHHFRALQGYVLHRHGCSASSAGFARATNGRRCRRGPSRPLPRERRGWAPLGSLGAGAAFHGVGLPAAELGLLEDGRIHAAPGPSAAQHERDLPTHASAPCWIEARRGRCHVRGEDDIVHREERIARRRRLLL